MIDPRHMSVIEWTDSMAFLLGGGVNILKLEDPEDWRQWAQNLIGEPDLVGHNAPDPSMFDDWREWAMRLNSTVELAG